MGKTEIIYLDDNWNTVPEEEATKINIIEYDDKGNRVKETYMVKSEENPEEAKKVWDEVEVNPESDILKNAVYHKDADPLFDVLNKQKTK